MVSVLEEVKDHPILFSAEMVRAILEGRKTQTRRMVRKQPVVESGYDFPHEQDTGYFWGKREESYEDFDEMVEAMNKSWPYGKPGDRLWVRESFKAVVAFTQRMFYFASVVTYSADGMCLRLEPHIDEWRTWIEKGKNMPSIHMPRWASRITLEVAEVRVQRLQQITEWDAAAEGVIFDGTYWRGAAHPKKGTPKVFPTAKEAFQDLWDSINGKRPGASWESNPWVWAITFRKIS